MDDYRRRIVTQATSGGREIHLPKGTWTFDAPLLLQDNTTISGQGPGTIIEGPGPGQVVVTGVRNGSDRQFSLALKDLTIDGRGGYIGVDWRNVSNGRTKNVLIRNVQIGALLNGSAFYNVIEDTGIDASDTGIEISDGANENHFVRGRVTSVSGSAIWVKDANNNHFWGPALESVGIGYRIGALAHATKIYGGRIEAAGLGVWLEPTATETTVFGPYMSSVTEQKRIQCAPAQYWWYGP